VPVRNALQVASTVLRFTRRHHGTFFISLGVCIASLVLYIRVYLVPHSSPWLRFLADLEDRTLDVRFALRGPQRPTPAVVIVAIDQKAEDVLGRWPFPRSVFAEGVDVLREAQARVIAFDANFPQPEQSSTLQALQEIAEHEASLERAPRNASLEAVLKRLEAQANNDKRLADSFSRFENTILGYYFLFSTKETQAQDRDRVSQFLNYLSFQTYPQVVNSKYGKSFNCAYCEAIGVSPNLPELAQLAKNFGFFNVVPDPDGTVRREPVIIRFEGGYYPSLDLAAALAYTNRSLEQVAVVFNRNGLERIDFGPVTIPTNPDGSVQIDFRGPAGTFPTYSLADLVQHKLPADNFRDRLVLIGATATGIGDMIPTPFQSMAFPGVEVHANFIDNLLRGAFIRRGLRENLIDLAVILLFGLPLGMLFSAVSPVRATVAVLAILALFLWWTQHVFGTQRVWLAVVLPTSTLLVNFGAVVTFRYFFEEREKRMLRGTFQHYVSPAVIKQLLERPESLHLGGEEKELTAMFADIRGFTSLSESLAPSALVELLNEYLSEMTETIFRHRGTLDKYIGDAIMVFWGAPFPQPDHANRACAAALEMLQVLRKLQTRWEKQGRPPIDIGIGINTGPMLVGNMGSTRRFNFTIIGDNVNLASRLEGLNKSFGTRLIISEGTYHYVRETVVTRELDLIRVKGKRKPVKIYEILGPIEQLDRYRGLTERFHLAAQTYREGRWETAVAMFGELLHDFPDDGPTRLFIQRCFDLLAEPPEEEWDGVYVMKSK
jgi:adenylate cyclase